MTGPAIRLTNLRIFDGDAFRSDLTSITVSDGIITAVEPTAALPDTGSVRLDMRGLYALPGMIDAHTHLIAGEGAGEGEAMGAFRTINGARKMLARGVTTVRDMSARDWMDLQYRDAVREDLLDGPDMFASGRGLTITGGNVHQRCVEVDGPDEVRKQIRHHIKKGVDWIKLMGVTGAMSTTDRHPLAAQFRPEEIEAACDEAHRAGYRVAAHALGLDGIRNAVLGGVDTIEHGIYLDDAVAEEMARRGRVLVPTLLNDLAFERARTAGKLSASSIARRQKLADEGLKLPTPEARMALARKHGVTVITGSDIGGNPNSHHGESALEIILLARTGYSTTEALHAATGGAADALGMGDRGRIAVGKRADIVLVTKDLSVDVEPLSDAETIAAVFKLGQLVAANNDVQRKLEIAQGAAAGQSHNR